MEVIFEGLTKCRSSNDAEPSVSASPNRNFSANDVGHKMEVGKKRGVYVERWANAKHGEDDKKHNKTKPQPTARPLTTRLLTTIPAESKISTYTRLMGTADPAVRFIKRKPKQSLPKKLVKQSKITSPSTQENVAEQQPNGSEILAKMKSKIKRSPSPASKSSYEASWSTIFPKREHSSRKPNLLQQHIPNYEQTSASNTKLEKEKFDEKAEDQPIYNFFIDLLESVYDEDIAITNNTDAPSNKSSDVTLEIDEHVAVKLNTNESVNYTIKDENQPIAYDQSRQFRSAGYSKNKLRSALPRPAKRKEPVKSSYYLHKPIRYQKNKPRSALPKPAKRKEPVKCSYCLHKPRYQQEPENTPKKPKLLNLLKHQLSLDFNMHQEPESMYEALLNIAKNKRKPKQIHFEDTDTNSRLSRVCRFQRRNVISPSTRLPKHVPPTVNFNSNRGTREISRTGSRTSTNYESSHSLEVFGYDYDETDIMEQETDYSHIRMMDQSISLKPIINLNEGITTVTQYWKP